MMLWPFHHCPRFSLTEGCIDHVGLVRFFSQEIVEVPNAYRRLSHVFENEQNYLVLYRG